HPPSLHDALPICQAVDHHRHPTRAITLIGDRFKGLALQLPGGLLDRPRDVFLGHVDRLSLVQAGAQAGVCRGVAAAFASRHHHLTDDLGEGLAALTVDKALLALGGRPFRMSRHRDPRAKYETRLDKDFIATGGFFKALIARSWCPKRADPP